VTDELLAKAVYRMLAGFQANVREERVEAFVSAVESSDVCTRCAAKAADRLGAESKKTLFPAHLVEAAWEVQGTSAHQYHVADRAALGPGDLAAWWRTEAPVIVRRYWPELNGETAIRVATVLGDLGYVDPDPHAIAVELGYVDDRGPTVEREWWYRDSGIAELPAIPGPNPLANSPRTP